MIIPLNDTRITGIVSKNIKPVVDVVTNADVVSSFRRDGNIAWFTIGELRKGVPIEVAVTINEEAAVFFPRRSAAHRQILKALGEG